MATFSYRGLDEFALSLQEIESIPDDVKNDMLSAGAEVAEAGLKKNITSYGLVDTGQLRNSIQRFHKVSKTGQQYYLVYPYGARKNAKVKKLSKVSLGVRKTYTIKKVMMRNNDVGFVHEFGAPRRGIPARPWLSLTAEQYADKITDAELRVYDKWLDSENL